ncbi:hypothetical protein [Phaeobacter sp. C3_T13_0]|uniref:hypothetical protein n=1 Tax=Phaeobacter cretensis TaxID=3342641 RepID=UPI0039BD2AFA
MPLEILVTMVLVGIVFIAILLHCTGRSAAVSMTRETAAKAWSRHDPDTQIRNALPNAIGHAALVDTNKGLGLVWCFGADTIARPLAGCRLADHPKGLLVRFVDFAAPSVLLHLSEEEKTSWRRHINDATTPPSDIAALEQTGETHG